MSLEKSPYLCTRKKKVNSKFFIIRISKIQIRLVNFNKPPLRDEGEAYFTFNFSPHVVSSIQLESIHTTA